MGIQSGSRKAQQIIPITRFEALPNVPVMINIAEVILLYPIFKWNPDDGDYADATGEYDLCMSEDGLSYKFISRRKVPLIFAYRYFPVNWIAKKLNV